MVPLVSFANYEIQVSVIARIRKLPDSKLGTQEGSAIEARCFFSPFILCRDVGQFTSGFCWRQSLSDTHPFDTLRIPDSYDAKIAKICNVWTFWPVFQLISHLFKIRQIGLFVQCLIHVKSAVIAFFTSLEHWEKGFLLDFENVFF